MPQEYLNSLDIYQHSEGIERRYELVKDILADGTFLPKTVTYEDIDNDFKRWVKEELPIVTDEGVEFPTMTMFSNQRFSEYAQSWQFTDVNKNILLNFKTVSRDNNPQFGKIQNGYWNIPGDRFYTMKRIIALDDNGTESYLDLKMKQPVAIDMQYKLSIFTTKFQLINQFNTMVNQKFASRQCYLKPQNHHMPMVLENISDESQYEIDNRQFYSQSYSIKVMAYIITEDDYKVEEVPLKRKIDFGFGGVISRSRRKNADVEIEEDPCNPYDPYYHQPVTLTITYPNCTNSASFTIDIDFVVESITTENLYNNFKVFINDELVDKDETFTMFNGDNVNVLLKSRKHTKDDAVIVMHGYNQNVMFDERKDNDIDNEQMALDYQITE